MYLKKFPRVYNAWVCFKMVYMIHVDEQMLPRNCTPVQKYSKNFFCNFLTSQGCTMLRFALIGLHDSLKLLRNRMSPE